MNRKGTGLIEASLSIGIFVAAGAAAYYFLYLLPQQNTGGSFELKVTPPTPTQPAPQLAPQKPKSYYLTSAQMQSPFEVGGVQYTVESAKNLGSDLSPSGFGYAKSNGGKYVLVKFNAKNLSPNDAPLGSIMVYLRDSNGNNFKPIGFMDGLFGGPSGYEAFTNAGYPPTTLKPGFKTELFIIAEVAADSSGFSVVVANQSDQNYFVSLGI